MQDDQEFNIKFVGLVEANPCLYDNTRDDYHLSHVQERAWANIAKSIGGDATIAECKTRWKNLRGSYTKHLKNYVPSGSGNSSKRPYYLSEYMSFVFPFTKTRKPKRNFDTPAEESVIKIELDAQEFETGELRNIMDDVGEIEKDQSDEEESDIILPNQPDIQEGSHYFDKKQQTRKKAQEQSLVQNEHKSKRAKSVHNEITLDDVNKSAYEYHEKKKQATFKPSVPANADADVQFLLSLLPDMKKMSDKQKRKYKIGILNLADQILDEPVNISQASIPIISPTSDSSILVQAIPSSSSSTACSSRIPSRSEYEDFSLSVHSPEEQDPLYTNSHYTFQENV